MLTKRQNWPNFENLELMRRSKSVPSKYVRNYRSLSQRRMTECDDIDEHKEIVRLRTIVREEDRKLHSEDDQGPQKRKRSDEGSDPVEVMLSGDLSMDNNSLYHVDDQNPLIVLRKRKKNKDKVKPVQLTPEEIKQAKLTKKNAERKLKQLESRSIEKEKRKTLYAKLRETSITEDNAYLLSSSSTLGKKVSKREQLKKMILKERAGIKLSKEEVDLLYRDRKEPEEDDKSLVNGRGGEANKRATNIIDSCLHDGFSIAVNVGNAERACEEIENNQQNEFAVEIGTDVEDAKDVTSEPVAVNDADSSCVQVSEGATNAGSVAAQIMASLTGLKANISKPLTKDIGVRAIEIPFVQGTDELDYVPVKRYIPENPVVLKTAATMNISPHIHKDQDHGSKKVRSVPRPEDVLALRYDLPVATLEFEVMDAIRNHDVTIICAETGSGKSTQVPQFLYEYGFSVSQEASSSGEACLVGVTQPRRVAAVSTAKRVSYEMGQGNGLHIPSGNRGEGNLVAYQTRFESAGLGSKTHIKFMTDGILLQEVQSDLLLRKYSVVILDEAHERGLNTDVLIGLLSACLQLRKKAAGEEGSILPPLKVVIMSATLRVEDFTENSGLFQSSSVTLVKVPGRNHPVTIHHSKVTELDNYEDLAFRKVCKIHRSLPPGGILLFLTGRQEIVRMVKRLKRAIDPSSSRDYLSADISLSFAKSEEPIRDLDDDDIDCDIFDSATQDELDPYGVEDDNLTTRLHNVRHVDDSTPTKAHILPLYSIMSGEDQAKVFAPVPEGHRLIVVATNIAETSITIPGISYVVDTGRQKCRNFNAKTGMASFDIMWISKAAADQRAGRSGRCGPGHCYRLYSSTMYSRHMDKFALPEVLTRPLEDVVLAMKVMRIQNISQFPFPTPPDKTQIHAAVHLLANIGCVTLKNPELEYGDGEITRLGIAVAKLPLGVRLGKILLVASQAGVLDYAIALVAAMSEPNSPFIPDGQLLENCEGRSVNNEPSVDEEDDAPDKSCAGRRQWSHAAGDAVAAMLAVGAYTYAGKGSGGASENAACAKFCRQNGLNLAVLQRIQKTRIQLARLAQVRMSDVNGVAARNGGVNCSMPPPSKLQEKLLCQSVASGLLDNIAMLAPSGFVSGTNASNRGYAYLRCSTRTSDPVFLDQSSVIYSRNFRQLPKWICYESLARKTLKDGTVVGVVKNVTPVEPSWIGLLAQGSNLLSIGEPLASPPPIYDAEKDAVMCSVQTKFGFQGWEIPPVKVEMFHALQSKELKHKVNFMADDSFRWFGRFLLEGVVLPELRDLGPMLNDSPALLTKRMPVAKVAVFVSTLASAGVDSAGALRKHWSEVNPKFLFSQLKAWIRPESLDDAKSLWISTVKKYVA